MYCGSCFRDNALATELMARGHDVTLVPVYTPTRTDEPNVSRRRVLFGGISVYLQQHAALFRSTPRFLDRLWDSPWLIGTFASRAVSTDARLLGELTISMLEGDRGVLRKEFDKLVDWIREEPLPDVINLPNSLLIGMAEPLRKAVGRPICCTLQGEELFLNGLTDPYPRSGDRHDPAAGATRRSLRRRQRLLRRVHVGSPSNPASSHRRRPARHWHGRLSSSGRPARPRDFCVGYFARIAPEKGLHVLADAYVQLRRRMGKAPARLVAAGYIAPAQASYLRDVGLILAEGGSRETSSRTEARSIATASSHFCESSMCCRCPPRTTSRRACFSSKRWLRACRSCSRVAAASSKSSRRQAEDCSSSQTIRGPRRRSLRLWSDPTRRRTLSDQAFAGVRAHYTIAQSADRLLALYHRVIEREPSLSASVA